MFAVLAVLPTDPLFYVIGGLTVFLMAFSKSAFGGGLALLGIPMFSLVTDPIAAAIITAPLLVVMDLFTMRHLGPATWSMPDVRWLLPGLIGGIGLGWLFYERANPGIVALVIGMVTLGFVIHWFLKGRAADTPPEPVRPGLALGLGSIAGFTTFVAHAGGPPIAMYLLRRGLDKTVFAGTNLIVFFVGNVVKLGPFIKLGLDRPHLFVWASVLVPVIPLGVLAGRILHERVGQKTLYLLCYILAGAAGLKLTVDACLALLR
jgi:hypothetical protein